MVKLLTTGETARRLAVSESTVKRLADQGLLRHMRAGKFRLFFPQGLASLKRGRGAKGQRPAR